MMHQMHLEKAQGAIGGHSVEVLGIIAAAV